MQVQMLINLQSYLSQAYTPFMLALESDEYEIAKYMLDHCKADMNKSYIDPRHGQLVFPSDIMNHFKSTQCKQLMH